jgi:hypothetical protein
VAAPETGAIRLKVGGTPARPLTITNGVPVKSAKVGTVVAVIST